MHKETIAIDFDGVINSYKSGFEEGVLPDPPTDGAIEWLKTLINSEYEIIIHSARLTKKENKSLIKKWLLKYGVTKEELNKLVFKEKPIAILYIDDLGWQFNGTNFPSLKEIANFKPWHEPYHASVINKLNKVIEKL